MNIFTGDDLYFIVVGDNFQIPLFLRERGREGIVMEIDKGTKDAAPFSNFFNLYLDMIRTDWIRKIKYIYSCIIFTSSKM